MRLIKLNTSEKKKEKKKLRRHLSDKVGKDSQIHIIHRPTVRNHTKLKEMSKNNNQHPQTDH